MSGSPAGATAKTSGFTVRANRPSAAPSKEAEAYQGQRWEYRARNLKKVAGMAMEADFNEHGAAGWEFVAVADGYAIFKRPRG